MATVTTDRRRGITASAAIKVACIAGSTANLTLEGEQTVDGIALVTGDRVLVKNQTSAAENGIYEVDTSSWKREPDWDGSFDVREGTIVPISRGTANSDTMFRISTTGDVIVGTTPVTFEPAGVNDSQTVSFLQAGTGAVSTTVQARLRETISVKDFGAIGNNTTDDTASFQAAIDDAINNDKAVRIHIPAGSYKISSSLTANPDGADERRNISFFGDGPNQVDGGTRLRYTGTDADGLFDLDSVQDFHFEDMLFFNDGASINQLVKIHASTASTLSAWKVTFTRCHFQNTEAVTNELSNGHIWAYNALDVSLQDCKFFGSPINVTLGIDSALTSGTAGGFTGRTLFRNTYFTGDVNLVRCEIVSFDSGCVFAEKWDNSGAFTDGARIYVQDQTFTQVLGLNCKGVQFEGLFTPSTFTDGAINLEDSTLGVTVYGCTFGSGYSRAIKVNRDCDGIDIVGNYSDQDASVNAKFISISSGFTGRLTQSNNHLSASMITDGGDLFVDNRAVPYAFGYLVDLLATSDYTILASNTFEKALTTAAVEWRAGMYRIKANAGIEGAGSQIVTMRITNTDGLVSRIHAEGSTTSGERINLSIDDIIYLDDTTTTRTWSIEVRQAGASGAIIKAITGGSSVASTYIQVIPI